MPELKLENVSYQYKHGDRKVVSEVTCLFEGGKLNSVLGASAVAKLHCSRSWLVLTNLLRDTST